MKRTWFPVLLLTLALVLSACNNATAFKFHNKAECGTATITITSNETARGIGVFTVEQGKKLEVRVDADALYSYQVSYEGNPDLDIVCDEKVVNARAKDGQTLNIDMVSVTPTPTAQ